jgi:hypothetical protein
MNIDLTNYGKMLIFRLFLKLLGYWLSWLFANILKKNSLNSFENKWLKKYIIKIDRF